MESSHGLKAASNHPEIEEKVPSARWGQKVCNNGRITEKMLHWLPETENPQADPDQLPQTYNHTEYLHVKLIKYRAGEELCPTGTLATHTGKHCFTLPKCEVRQLSWLDIQEPCWERCRLCYQRCPLPPAPKSHPGVFSFPQENGSNKQKSTNPQLLVL